MATNGLKKMGLAMLPFSSVTFDGEDALFAWTRLLLYSAGATLMWKRHRPTSYVLAGAAALSLLTSLSNTAYQKPSIAAPAPLPTAVQQEIDNLTK